MILQDWLNEKYTKQEQLELTVLHCSHNQITSLKGIETLVNLEYLSCSHNQLTSLKGIETLVNLKILVCYNNKLTSLKSIETLVNLKTLYCSNNQITNLEGIELLVNLKELYCDNNQLTSLKGVETLVNLKTLSCYNNPLSYKSSILEGILKEIKIDNRKNVISNLLKASIHINIIIIYICYVNLNYMKINMNNKFDSTYIRNLNL